MSTLYYSVPIKTVEQAEQLPEDAIIIDDHGDRFNRHSGQGEFWGAGDGDGIDLDTALALGGEVRALVPFEADSRPIRDPEGKAFTYYEAWVREP